MNKIKVNLFDFIFFDKGELGFCRWLPLSKEQALNYKNEPFHFKIYIENSYSESFTIKPDFSAINRSNHWVKALKIDISFLADETLYNSLIAGNPPQNFSKQLSNAYRHLDFSLRDICRNDMGQYWLTHPRKEDEEGELEILSGIRIANDNSFSKENLFPGIVRLTSYIPPKEQLIDENRWQNLEHLIENHYRADVGLVSLANAEYNLYKTSNYRIALIEAVISLERAIYTYSMKYIPEDYKGEAKKKLLKDKGLKEPTQYILPLISSSLEIDQDTIKNCINGIENRNLIVHRSRFKLETTETKKQIKSIAQVVRKLIPSKFL